MQDFTNGMAAGLITTPWVKSSVSEANGQCVELSQLRKGSVAMRNSTDPDGPALVFPAVELAAFLEGVKDGEFDTLVATN